MAKKPEAVHIKGHMSWCRNPRCIAEFCWKPLKTIRAELDRLLNPTRVV